MSSTVPPLYHMGTAGMMVGDIVRSGEFGQSLMGSGALHPCQPNGHPDYFREYLMEIYRLGANSSAISRLACTFAFESQELAIAGACESGRQAFQVVPVDPDAPATRHDSSWITWISEPLRSPSEVEGAIDNYWNGLPVVTGPIIWEWLVPCDLRIMRRIA